MISQFNKPAAFGVGQGEWPSYGSKVFAFTADITAAGLAAGGGSFDITNEIMSDQIDFIQSVYIDNADNNTRVDLTCAVTGQRVTCPPQAQGIFSLLIPPGSIQCTISGPAAKIKLLFSNMPLAPNVWKVV